MNIYYVYSYLRSRNSSSGLKGSPYYIGKGSNGRAYDKRHGNTPIPKDKSNIVFLETNLSENKAFEIEKFLIAYYGRKDLGTGILLNRTDGGEGPSNRIFSNETRKKLSDAQIGKSHSLETRQKMSNAAKGRIFSNETRQKLSNSHKGKNGKAGKDNPMFNKNHSNEAKIKMSNAAKNRPIIKCPHCEKEGTTSNMKRWHFYNCKFWRAVQDSNLQGQGRNLIVYSLTEQRII
jgi:hypothetical protein